MNDPADDVASPEDASSENSSHAEILTLLGRMKQQLDFLEKKVDMLVNQSKETTYPPKAYPPKSYGDKPFGEKRFQKPFRTGSYKPDFRRDKEGGGSKPDFRRDKEERYSRPKPVYSSHPKKRAANSQDFEHGTNFKKRAGERGEGFSHTKKPGFFKKKDRG